jgi:hypothetical protein
VAPVPPLPVAAAAACRHSEDMKVSICTPVHGDPKAGYTRSLAAMLLATASLPKVGAFEKLRLSYTLTSGHLLPTRDHLAKSALAAGADKILWIDADQTFPPDTLIRLLARNLRIVGANYVRRGGRGGGPLATSLAGGPVFTTAEKAKAQEVEEVAGLGLGLVLMDAAIFNEIAWPWFETSWREDGTIRSEDHSLFAKIGEAGIPVHVDHGLSWQIGHVAEEVLTHEDAMAAELRRQMQLAARHGKAD